MNLREIFQETRIVCKKNSSVFLGFNLAIFAVFFAVCVAFTFVGVEWSFLLIFGSFALVIPMFIGIDFIAKKAVNSEEIDYRDFYLGHRNFLTSISLETKVLTRGVLFAILGVFATSFLGIGAVIYYIILEYPEISNLVNQVMAQKETMETLVKAISSIGWFETAINIVDTLSLVVGAICYIWQGKRYIFLPYICLETRFNLQTALYLSKESSDSIKKPLFGYNILYLLIILLVIGVSIGAYHLSLLLFVEKISLVVAYAVACLLLAPVFMEYKVSLYVIYAKNFKTEIDHAFKMKMEEVKQNTNIK